MKKEAILFENQNVIVINKPPGKIVEVSPFEEDTVQAQIEAYLFEKRMPFVGVVHRLDRVTSGALIFAKKKNVLKFLNKEFEKRNVNKIYHAVVQGDLKQNTGVLLHFHAKDLPQKKAIIKDKPFPGGKECKLSFKVIGKKAGLTLVEIKLHTGKFHQIRAQFGFFGHPIIGDEKYGSQIPLEKNQIALHAYNLEIALEEGVKRSSFIAPLPAHPVWDF